MKFLVTGAAGFLGSHIVDRCLSDGHHVRVLVRPTSDLTYLRTLPDVEMELGDITDRSSLEKATRDIEVVIHSAARVTDVGSRKDFFDTNVRATEHLLDAAKRNGARRFVFVSSPSVVMDGRDQVDIDESVPYPSRFFNLYSETKALAEQAVLARGQGEAFTTCALRPRAVWGPRDTRGWFPKILAKLATGRMPDLSGGRRVHASLCYCTNAADACVLAACSDRVAGKAYFVTDAEKTDVWAFAHAIIRLFGLPPLTRRINPRILPYIVNATELIWKAPFLARTYAPPLSRYAMSLLTCTGTYSIAAAERDLGYRPAVDQATGLEHLVRWVHDTGGVDQLLARASAR